MNLRTQLKNSKESEMIKVVEIVPPTVSTDLHRERVDPDDNKKEKNPDALSVEEFMGFVKKGLGDDRDTVAAGMGEGIVEKWYGAFGESYEKAAKK
jgi:short-subunit dehydrogenase involved in D-alanine esterification of teichoic acids